MIKYQLRGLIHSGLAAIEWQMLEVSRRKKILTDQDKADLKALSELYQRYGELLLPQAQQRFTARRPQSKRHQK